jgi:hypothetical protein
MNTMKSIILTLILIILTTNLYAQTITIDANGIVKCNGVGIGTTEVVSGDTYEVVDRTLLIQRRNEGADLTKVCVSNVTDMSDMFRLRQFDQPIGNWDVSKVTSMRQMFDGSPFNHPIRNWDVSNVTDMSFMFSRGQFDQPIGNWNVSSVTDMTQMFSFSPFNQSIGEWVVSSVTRMSNMFAQSSFNQPIGDWDVSKVTAMTGLFSFSPFNQPIGNWDVGSVSVMFAMFRESPFNQPIGDWDVSNVTNMGGMFRESPFNQPIGDWDVSSVTSMDEMFYQSQFNQPIYTWCVTNITSEPQNFSIDSPLTAENKPNWGTCTVTSTDTEEVPTLFTLNQNFPNPFNPTTQIQFTLPVSTVVRLEVFSVLGQRTVTLLNEHMPVGEHIVPFDAGSLSSGVYIYRLSTPEFTQSRFMNLIK